MTTKTLDKIITGSFIGIFFFCPLFFLPVTSELFEFNKIIFTYTTTSIIVSFWISKMIVERRIIFSRTMLDIPILIFLFSQIISTIFSIDPHTSIFGYYSRFNGGLLSIVSYTLLFFAFTANIRRPQVLKIINALFCGSILVCLYAILQHFGIDKDYWREDVQRRVFSTFGQPNWLAAWVASLIPLSLAFYIKNKKHFYFLLSIILFITLLFTKSRSGILGLLTALAIFASTLTIKKKSLNKLIKNKVVYVSLLSFLAVCVLVGTPWTPNLVSFSTSKTKVKQKEVVQTLEEGGTESGEIRKIVWKGAFDVFKNYPLIGSGVETFAYSYYQKRPVEHNLVSEWDFLYNKAHNEYLNFLATTGIFGATSYLVFITATVYLFLSNIKKGQNTLLNIGFLASFASIAVSNFFGFSVTGVNHIFYLLAAMSFALTQKQEKTKNGHKRKMNFLITLPLILLAFTLYKIYNIWTADCFYAEAKTLNEQGKYNEARIKINKAIGKSHNEAIYFNEISKSALGLSLDFYKKGNKEDARFFGETAINEAEEALRLSPKNMNVRRNHAANFIALSEIDKNLLVNAEYSLKETVKLAPTDAKIFYNLALVQMKLEENNKAQDTFEKAIVMKDNYKEARYALALLLSQKGDYKEALEQIDYIVDNLGTTDERIINYQKNLQEILY